MEAQIVPVKSKAQEKIAQVVTDGIYPEIANSQHPLRGWIEGHQMDMEQAAMIKKRRKRVAKIIRELLAPQEERSAIHNKNDGPKIFGHENLFSLIANIDKKENPQILRLNIGMSCAAGEEPSLGLPAYLELGIQRIISLRCIGIRAQLRMFSTGSLSPQINGSNPEQVREAQQDIRNLYESYICHFYPSLISDICLKDLCMEISIQQDIIHQIADVLEKDLKKDVKEALYRISRRYSRSKHPERKALEYAAYHCIPETFQDQPRDEKGKVSIISIGGPGEALFNDVRFQLIDPALQRLGIVIGEKIIDKTPPYLHLEGRPSLSELKEGAGRLKGFYEDPFQKKFRRESAGIRELQFLGRCLGQNPESKNSKLSKKEKREKEKQETRAGLEKLREFYNSL
jgi:hypothetical protein